MTFFTTAKPFRGHEGVIQRNALKSWKLLDPDVEVILFGDDEGADAVSMELGLRHELHVERHESGMKYLNYMFERAQDIAIHDFLCYSNCDIIFLPDFNHAVKLVTSWKQKFLLLAQRHDTDVTHPIDFSNKSWAQSLRQMALASGVRQNPHFKDFFVFPRGLYDSVPPLVVGRSAWDSWLVWKALNQRVPVVDATPALLPVHQNHSYCYHPEGKKGTDEDALAMRNVKLCGNGKHLAHITDSTHCITQYGRIQRTRFRGQISKTLMFAQKLRYSVLMKTFHVRGRLGLTRRDLRHKLGRRGGSLK